MRRLLSVADKIWSGPWTEAIQHYLLMSSVAFRTLGYVRQIRFAYLICEVQIVFVRGMFYIWSTIHIVLISLLFDFLFKSFVPARYVENSTEVKDAIVRMSFSAIKWLALCWCWLLLDPPLSWRWLCFLRSTSHRRAIFHSAEIRWNSSICKDVFDSSRSLSVLIKMIPFIFDGFFSNAFLYVRKNFHFVKKYVPYYGHGSGSITYYIGFEFKFH